MGMMKISASFLMTPLHLRNPILQDAHRMGILDQWKLDKQVV